MCVRRSGAAVAAALLLLVSACESPRLGAVLQGESVPAQARSAKDVQPPPRRTPPPVPESQAPAPAAAAPAAAAPAPRKVPSLVPYLTGQVPPRRPADEGQPVPMAPLKPSSTVRAALLVPLSGPDAFSRLGRSMLDAAQMAVFDFSDSHFELLIHDTEGTPEGAMEAARLAIGDGASVILGPLLAPSISAIAPMARAAGVPVIGYSSDRTIAGDGIYTMGFFPETEVERVVAFTHQKGVRRFAALVPNDAYGQAAVGAMQQTAMAIGAEVTRVRFYDPATSDFSGIVRDLGDYDSRRQALLDQRAQLEGKEDEISVRALKRLERLQTIGDPPFDALLLAEGDKPLQAIAALLPFYDIDPKRVRMLGTGRWDEPGLGAEPALLGGWYAGPLPAARADFETQFAKVYGRKPERLATLAYDATALAAVMSRATGGSVRGPDFSAAAMTVASGFWGRDGIFRFAADGTVERGLAVLQVTSQGARMIDPAGETF